MENKQPISNEAFALSSYECLIVTPYMRFANGAEGSVLVMNFDSEEAYLLMFNSPERIAANENRLLEDKRYKEYGHLLMSEAERFIQFRDECLNKNDDAYCMSQEVYEKYGVVLLARHLFASHIADRICIKLNENRRAYFWLQSRLDEQILFKSASRFQLMELDEDVSCVLSEERSWRGTIVSQAMQFVSKEKSYLDEIQEEISKARNMYIDLLRTEKNIYKLYLGRAVMSEYHDKKKIVDWKQLMEKTHEQLYGHSFSFVYSDYSIQEIMGFFELCKYLYIERPDYFVKPQFVSATLDERVQLYDEYLHACTDEMLTELLKEDDPSRIEKPNREEAQELAKERMVEMIGKIPEGLPEEQKARYAKYEEGFLKKIGIAAKSLPTKKTSRPNATKRESESDDFLMLITHEDKQKVLSELHNRIDHRKGKAIGIVIAAAAYKYNVLSRTPTEKEFRKEFTDIENCSWRSISQWLAKVNKPEQLHKDISDVLLRF